MSETKIARIYGLGAKPWRPRGKMIFEQLIFNSCERMNCRNSSRKNGFYHKLWHCYSKTAIACSDLKHPSFLITSLIMILNKLLFWPLRHCSIVNYKLQRSGNISVKQHSRKGHRFNVVSASATERFHFLDPFTNTLYTYDNFFVCY